MTQSFIPNRYADEYETVSELLRLLPWDDSRAVRVTQTGADLITRSAKMGRKPSEIENFLRQYGLDTQEGVALVCLAEALLRIPDAATANELIRDKITAVNWLQSRTQTSDWMVRAARYGLSFTKSALDSFASKLGEPLIRAAILQGIRMMGKGFVLGEKIDDAIMNGLDEMKRGYAFSFDMLGEGARTSAMADRYYQSYIDAIHALARARRDGFLAHPHSGISVKLSALHPRYTPLQRDRCAPVLIERLLHLCNLAAQNDLTLTVDAEETERLTLSLDIIAAVAGHGSIAGWNGFGLAVQAYQKYAPALVDHVTNIAHDTNRRLRLRLVKGAYWDTEIKRAQVMGLPDYPLFTRKANTDLSYLTCAHKMLMAGDYIYPMFATHNAHTAASILDFTTAQSRGVDTFEFQRLHGMGAALFDTLLADKRAEVTVYAPVGSHEDLLAYLVRRLLENGANSSFVRHMNEGMEARAAAADPAEMAEQHPSRRHKNLPLPHALYGDARKNSRGYDIAQDAERDSLSADAVPDVRVPPPADQAVIDAAIARAQAAFPAWNETSSHDRAAILEKFADMIEDHAPDFISLCASEGFKTWGDGIAELREAADFARYYAAQARTAFAADGTLLPGPTGEENRLILEGRGVFVCISPWNFPLAIFTGQVCAALAAGNTVIAKPAEQTPKIAAHAVSLLHAAGVPQDALHLLIGDGKVGAAIVSHPDIAGVAFTGSNDVARAINRTLAARETSILPLIAETGGQNAMIVDSTALLEQVCDDVIASAFGSAGQRCSALRVLYVQEDIADRVIDLVAGAMHEIRVGDPADPRSDVGPVIDADAHARLRAHTDFLTRMGAKKLAETPLDQSMSAYGHYFAPAMYEIPSVRALPGEVFGPILHVVRFASGDVSRVMADIAATGYALTFGLHSRIDARINTAARAAAAGNVYINRNMIGAVVGVQPFGGHGLSGTGPKAGGPHYLIRFANERTITRNTAASGGNIALVAGGD